MNRWVKGLLLAPVGYILLAVAGYFAISAFSSNTHDRGVEAAMTAAFLFGPLGAIIGFVIGFRRAAAR